MSKSKATTESGPEAFGDTASSRPGLVPGGNGRPGASAQREHERRAQRERVRHAATLKLDEQWRSQVLEAHPVVGRLVTAMTPRPVAVPKPSTEAWRRGAVGEMRVAEVLRSVPGVAPLHDRRIGGSKANIDHLVVGPAGVFVVDAKRWTGAVERRDVGGWRRVDDRLYVNGRDRSNAVDGVRWQVDKVVEAMGSSWPVPVHGVLCFVGAEWPLLRRSFVIGGVSVVWPKGLGSIVGQSGPLDRDTIRDLATHLALRLPAA